MDTKSGIISGIIKRIGTYSALILSVVALLAMISYFMFFRYRQLSSISDSHGNTIVLYYDDLLSQDVDFESCYCIGETYFGISVNDEVIYRFYTDFQQEPVVSFFSLELDGDTLVIPGKKITIKAPYRRGSITRRQARLLNVDLPENEFEYYKSDKFLKSYTLNYFVLPKFGEDQNETTDSSR